jgi:hypothetical protein
MAPRGNRPVHALVGLLDEPAVETARSIFRTSAPNGYPTNLAPTTVAWISRLAECAESMADEAQRQGPILTANVELLELYESASTISEVGKELSKSAKSYTDVLARHASTYDESR